MYNTSKIIADKIIFLDIDGCVTSKLEGNYFNPDPKKYHPSKKIVNKLITFCVNNNVKIVISSNWRKFDIDGIWKNSYGTYKNPIAELRKMISAIYFCTLPPDRHITKSEALIKWLITTGYNGKFVIFDDDLCENYQNTLDFDIKNKFILVNSEIGISDNDLKQAKQILEN